MANAREKTLATCMRMLEQTGFSSVSISRFHSPFSAIAKRKEEVYIFKVVQNIDSISQAEGEALTKLSVFFNAHTYIIGSGYKSSKVEEGMAFSRHGVDCISAKTLEDLLSNKKPRHADKFIRGKMHINGYELRRLRKLAGLSQRGLAGLSGLSKDSIYKYERGSAAISSESLERLERVLLSNLGTESYAQERSFSAAGQTKVGELLFMETDRAPFEVVCRFRHRFEFAKMTDQRTMKKIADFYKEFDGIFNDRQFIIADSSRAEAFGIPIISRQELNGIASEADLIEMAEERSS
ncbi:helix-turn-helix domain-containing protein [Candidatus Marsarchaeota archaeon]|nr:helix-turn-helix domain-containing protein [Candidatus Marsarchaeota archaeon]MCL5404214.1 helix-turn-helix domain-containing protein [Candidatus Marsarchaeota archaeon]